MKINRIIKTELELSIAEQELLRKTADFLSKLNMMEGSENILKWIVENEVNSLNDFEDMACILSILTDEDFDFELNF